MRTMQRIRKADGEVVEREKLIRWINRLLDKMPDGEIVLEINPTERTDAQNRYYWSILGEIGCQVGERPEKLHEQFKEMFLPRQDYFTLIKKKQVQSTTDLQKDQMVEYIDSIRRVAAEGGIVTTDAEEYKHKQI